MASGQFLFYFPACSGWRQENIINRVLAPVTWLARRFQRKLIQNLNNARLFH